MPSLKDRAKFRGDLGEAIVTYELMKRDWDVLKNLGGHGYDLLISKGRVNRRIEVKTTDPDQKTGRTKNQLTVILSESEYQHTDFLIFYIHRRVSVFFIIPRTAFPPSRSITVFVDKHDNISSGSAYESYRDRWDLLE